ncbi:MAG TPA: ATP-dependent DNA ligase, partial [Candidatus Xenobia bacterium]
MAATLTDRRFSDPQWIFERKLDGLRALAFKDGGEVRLLSRNQLPFHFPPLAEA